MITATPSRKVHLCIICMHCFVLGPVEHRTPCVCVEGGSGEEWRGDNKRIEKRVQMERN